MPTATAAAADALRAAIVALMPGMGSQRRALPVGMAWGDLVSAGHATVDGIATVCGIPRSEVTLKPGVDCPECLAILNPVPTRRTAPPRMPLEAYARLEIARTRSDYLEVIRQTRRANLKRAAFWAVMAVLALAGLIGLALTPAIPGIG